MAEQGLDSLLYEEQWVTLPSTCIDEIKYQHDAQILSIRFHKGRKSYDYPNISPMTVTDLYYASSPGRYYHAYLQ